MDASPSISKPDGTALEGYSLSSGNPDVENGELRLFVIDFVDFDVPDSLHLSVRVHDNGSYETSAPMPASVENDLFRPSEKFLPDFIATFEFDLSFDPYYTGQGETVILNQDFTLDGQRLTITTVEIFPTHMRVNFKDDATNTAWLQSIEFYFENEKGKRFEPISNGITASGSGDSPMMASHRLESAFFSESEHLTLHITNVIWLDKDKERIKVDLANCTAENLPEGVTFEQAVQKSNGWELTFAGAEREENASYQLFGQTYYDEEGNEYMYNSWSSGETGYYDEQLGEYVETPGVFRVKFALVDYPYDTVYLSPSFSRMVTLDEAVVVEIK